MAENTQSKFAWGDTNAKLNQIVTDHQGYFMWVMILIVCIIVIEICKTLYRRWYNYQVGTPFLIAAGTLDMSNTGNYNNINTSNPDNPDFILMPRSSNEDYGIEFTYSFWIIITDFTVRENKWKSVFHKGNKTSWPNRAPGIFLGPVQNDMYIFMNTYNQIDDHVVIKDIPLTKWVHVAVMVKGRYLDTYINGRLKIRHTLNGLPKQNSDDIWIGNWGGFGGYLSQLRYYSYAINTAELEELIRSGPNLTSACLGNATVEGSAPPYLYYNWWTNYYLN